MESKQQQPPGEGRGPRLHQSPLRSEISGACCSYLGLCLALKTLDLVTRGMGLIQGCQGSPCSQCKEPGSGPLTPTSVPSHFLASSISHLWPAQFSLNGGAQLRNTLCRTGATGQLSATSYHWPPHSLCFLAHTLSH